MRRLFGIVLALLSVFALAGWYMLGSPRQDAAPALRPAPAAPAGSEGGDRSHIRPIPWGDLVIYQPIQGSRIELSGLEKSAPSAIELARGETEGGTRRPEIPIPQSEADRLRAESGRLLPNDRIQRIQQMARNSGGGSSPLKLLGSFEAINGSEACGPCVNTPPDPEMAVGPDHIVAGVNVALVIYDKQGTLLTGPVYFRDLFRGVPGCRPRYFDPTVVYDEAADRFVVGIDSAAEGFCVAASAGPDPTAGWHRYHIQTIEGREGEFFDYPHLGVGHDAIYLGATNFIGNFDAEGRAWAIDKASLYSGGPLQVVSRALAFNADTNPQPAHLHGFAQGTWPTSGPHYFVTDDVYDGATYGVFSWADPFDGSGGTLTRLGDVDLNAATGIVAGFPIDVPQKDGEVLWGNDWRAQDAELRNGDLWFTTTIACNPGAGTVNCARWARIDPANAAVLDSGVFASDGVHRTYGDLDVDHCGNMVMGYSIASADTWPGIAVAGRRNFDPPATVRPEVVVIEGEAVYTAFDGVPHRWGDYTEVAVDPNGEDFYYFNQYAKDIEYPDASYGTNISKLTFKCKAKTK